VTHAIWPNTLSSWPSTLTLSNPTPSYARVRVNVDKFTGKHYQIWACIVKAALSTHGLLYCIQRARDAGDREEIICFGLLQSYVDVNILASLPP